MNPYETDRELIAELSKMRAVCARGNGKSNMIRGVVKDSVEKCEKLRKELFFIRPADPPYFARLEEIVDVDTKTLHPVRRAAAR